MDDSVLMAALAGLLHDVGKFAQRAGEQVSGEWSEAKTQQDFGYQHALHTWYFVNKYLPEPFKAAGTMAAFHHRPKEAGIVVQIADHLSAGERADPLKDDRDRKSQPRQLQSIFGAIKTKGKDAKGMEIEETVPKVQYLPLEELQLRETVLFPKDALPESAVWTKYEMLWREFCREAEALKQWHTVQPDLEAYLESMLALLQRYTWSIPSAYYHTRPDVSLYDHSRMTAALAAILAASGFSGATLKVLAEKPLEYPEPVALLIGGDISGVQDFIYTITSKGATSSLRGRSFYLQLLTEAAVRFTLRELGLPVTNVIYAGGGNFYLLACASDKDKLDGLRQKLSRILYKHHQGDLYLAIESLPLKASDFMRLKDEKKRHPLSDKWGELARKVAIVKNRRFSELTLVELQSLFVPKGHGGNEDWECKVCGREHPQTKARNGESILKCPACQSYEELGQDLRDAQYIGWQFLEHPQTVNLLDGTEIPGEWQKAIKDLGFSVKVSGKFDEVSNQSRVWALNGEALKQVKRGLNQIIIRRFMVNVTPHLNEGFVSSDGQPFKKGDIKPFEKLAADSSGITRLGVLRMDVDNLGRIFAEGLGNDATLSRIASLSFAVSLFFEGWVGKLAQDWNNKHGDRLYAIYSGGDDLFFVGSWDVLAEFALEIRNQLGNYVAGHPGIHLSGGMVLVGEKYPLAKAAEDAHHAEEAAKKLKWWHQNEKREKNVFSLFGQPLPWENFEKARALREPLESAGQSVIRTLLNNYALYSEAEEERRKAGKDQKQFDKPPQTLYGPWNWRIVYTLKRNNVDKSLIEKLHETPAMLEWLGVAARWAELKNRNASKEE
jgi:CRISPR-associated protein Csm1